MVQIFKVVSYHKLGTKPQDDILIVKADSDPSATIAFHVTNDKNFIIVYEYFGSDKSRVYLAPLNQTISTKTKWLSIAPKDDLELDYIQNLENIFYFVARYDDHSNQVVKFNIDPTKARQVNDFSELKDKINVEPTVIPEDKSALIDRFTTFDTDKMFLCYTQDAERHFYIYNLRSGERIEHVLPDYKGASSSIIS